MDTFDSYSKISGNWNGVGNITREQFEQISFFEQRHPRTTIPVNLVMD